jgi:Spy/CpxP family protein refolding chaperone
MSGLDRSRPTWHHPKVLVVLFVVFLCGAAAGSLATRMISPRSTASAWKDGGKTFTLEMLKKELDLTPDQAVQIETVLDEFVLYYQNLQGQMDDFRSDGKDRILRVLTPEQREKFNRKMTELNARIR